MQHYEYNTKLGTLSGTVLTVAGTIGTQDLFKTVLLASIGAVVSFVVSLLLKWLAKRFKK